MCTWGHIVQRLMWPLFDVVLNPAANDGSGFPLRLESMQSDVLPLQAPVKVLGKIVLSWCIRCLEFLSKPWLTFLPVVFNLADVLFQLLQH